MLDAIFTADPAMQALLFCNGAPPVTYGDLARAVERRAQELNRNDSQKFRIFAPELDKDSIVEIAAALLAETPLLLVLPSTPPAERARLEAELSSAPPPRPEDRLVLCTSGSTQTPKLVIHTRQSLEAAAEASERNLGWAPGGDRWYLSLPLGHVGGLALLLRCLRAGQTVVVGAARSSNPGHVFAELRNSRVTLASFVPTQLGRLLNCPEFEPWSELRAVLVGGAPLSAPLRERAETAGVPLLATYGLTEMSSQVSTESLERTCNASQSAAVGRPLWGARVEIDTDGRVWVGGAMAMRGYLGKPSPFDERGLLPTNDIGCLDDQGRLFIFGRADNVIITGGENVSPEAIEAALVETGLVEEACVIGVADPDWGERVVAYVTRPRTPLETPPINAEALRERLSLALPPPAIPKEIRWVEMLPQLPNGKLDRRALKKSANVLEPAHQSRRVRN